MTKSVLTGQGFKGVRSDQAPFQTVPPQDLPFQEYQLGYEHLLDTIDRVYRRAEALEELIIGLGIFALKERRRTEQCKKHLHTLAKTESHSLAT
jgi:hypothetical protein